MSIKLKIFLHPIKKTMFKFSNKDTDAILQFGTVSFRPSDLPFSTQDLRICSLFLIFCTKLDSPKARKGTKPVFFKKKSPVGSEKPKKSPIRI